MRKIIASIALTLSLLAGVTAVTAVEEVATDSQEADAAVATCSGSSVYWFGSTGKIYIGQTLYVNHAPTACASTFYYTCIGWYTSYEFGVMVWPNHTTGWQGHYFPCPHWSQVGYLTSVTYSHW